MHSLTHSLTYSLVIHLFANFVCTLFAVVVAPSCGTHFVCPPPLCGETSTWANHLSSRGARTRQRKREQEVLQALLAHRSPQAWQAGSYSHGQRNSSISCMLIKVITWRGCSRRSSRMWQHVCEQTACHKTKWNVACLPLPILVSVRLGLRFRLCLSPPNGCSKEGGGPRGVQEGVGVGWVLGQ